MVETFLVEKVKSIYPSHQIISEEGARVKGENYSWVIDPIDGTAAYIWGLPTWCISIGLLHDMQPYWGMVFVPLTGDVYSINDEGQAVFNGQNIIVSPKQEIDKDSVLLISSHATQKYDFRFPGSVYALGSGILHHCLTARGVAVGSLTLKPSLWDLAGVCAILGAMGMVMRYLSGEEVKLADLYSDPSAEPILIGKPETIDTLASMIIRKF